jgi:heme ABC exporter ATP-binding subunit CcmA
MSRVRVDIVLRGVTRTYGPLIALDGIDLAVPAGSAVALMGANGAGKTTLLRVVAGLTTPTSGTVTVAGVDRREAGGRLRALLGYVGHESMLYGDLTVRENLAFHAGLHGLDRDAVVRAAARFDITHALDRPARELSRGSTQRAALARALLHDPAVVLLDEPFTGLDLASSERLAATLGQLHDQGHTVVLTVHDAVHACLAQRLLVLDRGRVVVDEVPADRARVEALLRRAAAAASDHGAIEDRSGDRSAGVMT